MTAAMKQQIANIKAEAKRKSEYEQILATIRNIVATCAASAKKDIMTAGMNCDMRPFNLYYRTGELRLSQVELDGFTNSGRAIPLNVPFTSHESWIANNSRDLAIL